jgi:hypothetical protein
MTISNGSDPVQPINQVSPPPKLKSCIVALLIACIPLVIGFGVAHRIGQGKDWGVLPYLIVGGGISIILLSTLVMLACGAIAAYHMARGEPEGREPSDAVMRLPKPEVGHTRPMRLIVSFSRHTGNIVPKRSRLLKGLFPR